MITGIYAGICGLLLVVLYVRISQRRLATKIGVGSGGDAELEQRVRAHGNLVESAPFALILLYLIEQTEIGSIYVHALGATFIAARVAHHFRRGRFQYQHDRRLHFESLVWLFP